MHYLLSTKVQNCCFKYPFVYLARKFMGDNDLEFIPDVIPHKVIDDDNNPKETNNEKFKKEILMELAELTKKIANNL